MNWVAWVVLVCVVLALLMLWNLSRHDQAKAQRMHDTRRTHGSKHHDGPNHADQDAVAAAAHNRDAAQKGVQTTTSHVAASHSREVDTVRQLAGAVAGAHGHQTAAGGGRWIDWLSGFSVLALIGAALLVNKCDFAKKSAQGPASGQAIAQSAVDTQLVENVAAEVEETQVADNASEQAPAEVIEKAADPVAGPAKIESGVTQYYGASDPTAIMAWSAEASMNPEYAEAAQEPAAAEPTPAETEVAAAPEQEAAAEAVPGVTQYYGVSEKMDAEQAWAAPATVFDTVSELAPAAAPEPRPEAVAEAVPGVTQFYGYPDEDAKPPLWAEDAELNPDYAADEPVEPEAQAAEETPAAPVAEAVPGITQYYGVSEKADAEQAWAAPATVFETVSEPAPATEPESASQAVAEAVPGVTQYYGTSEKPDLEQAWSAPATVFASEAEPAKQEAVEACRDALNAEVKTGTLNFYTSSWEIDTDSWPTLDRIARTAKNCSAGYLIEVGGHTDNKGKPASNQTLSELRANAVVKYLIKAGVPEGKLKAVGFGQNKPIDDNGSVDGRRKNRRIEFTVSGG